MIMFSRAAAMVSMVCAVCVVADKAPPPPPPPPMDFVFGSAFGSNMVLQQEPAKAAVYGFLGVNGTGVTVNVESEGKILYSVAATINSTNQPYGPSYGVRPCAKEDCPPYDMGPLTPYNAPVTSWKALLNPTKPFGNYTIRAVCTGCNVNQSSILITNVTFGDVWYCSGQSNMWLPVENTFSRNDSVANISAGMYSNIRIMAGGSGNHPQGSWPVTGFKYGDTGGSNPWMTVGQAIADGNSTRPTYSLFQFGGTCWYYARRLAELGVTVPLGFADTAIGGQRIEEYMNNETINVCSNRAGENIPWWDGVLFASQVIPFTDMTIKGWVWYQGENNMGAIKGNSQENIGYSCEQRELINGWRKIWSKTPGTTDPKAPFGIVTLASSGSEGGPNMGAMRLAQTAGHGVLPTENMPNTFFAQAYDLDDEWGPALGLCFTNWSCCEPHYNATSCTSEYAAKCKLSCAANVNTASKGGIHPRSKKPVGDRLGSAAYNTVYGGLKAYTGPTLSGCSVDSGSLKVQFNPTLLRGDKLAPIGKFPPVFQKPGRHQGKAGGTQLYVQINATLFCLESQPVPTNDTKVNLLYCPTWAGGKGENVHYQGWPAETLDQQWIMLNYTAGSDGISLDVDLSPLNGTMPTSVRYGWGVLDCCDYTDPNLYVTHGCIATCPVMSTSGFPANPFQAKIVNGKCECVAPQVCS